MKKIFLFILFIFLSFTNVYAEDYEYVVDEGNILSNETEEYIETYSTYLKENADIDYYVITTDTIGNYNISDYASVCYDNFVDNDTDSGLVIVISKNERVVNVVAGKGISGVITTDVINEFINNYFISDLSTGDWDKGVKNGYNAFFKLLCINLDIDTDGLEVTNGNDFFIKYRYYILFVCIFIANTIGYLLPKYFIKLFRKEHVTIIHHLIFYGTVFVNVLLLYFNCIYNKKFLLVVLAFELFSIMSGTYLHLNNSSNGKKKIIKRRRFYRKIK